MGMVLDYKIEPFSGVGLRQQKLSCNKGGAGGGQRLPSVIGHSVASCCHSR